MGPSTRLAALLAAAGLAAAGARAQVACVETNGGPGEEITARLEILSPADGAIVVPTGACGQDLVVAGTWSVDAPPLLHDFYLVIDTSGSTGADSGADVDGDGLRGGPGDTIRHAEIAAAQAFVRALDPALSRVAVVSFSRRATLEHALSADLASVLARLDAMNGLRSRWGTGYLPALEAVHAEALLRGGRPARLQRCIFLSDGRPDESLPEIHAATLALVADGVVIDTFALGRLDSQALADMASLSGGRFTSLPEPGGIVALLPGFVPELAVDLQALNELTARSGSVSADSGAFEALVRLVPGINRVTLTMRVDSDPPLSVDCSIDVTLPESLVARAGPDRGSCSAGGPVLMDGAASSFGPCTAPLYRWLDCRGEEACPWSPDPTCFVPGCGTCFTWTLEIGCDGEPCAATDVARVDCVRVPAPEPTVLRACPLSASLACGTIDPVLDHSWDLDARVDADGDGDPANDADAWGCEPAVSFDAPGARTLVAWAIDPASGCREGTPLDLVVAPEPTPRNLDGGACPGAELMLSAGPPAAGEDCWWDLDAAADADSDGDPANDADLAGCDVLVAWSDEGVHEVRGWRRDATGCVTLAAAGALEIVAEAIPGEVPSLRVSRSAGDLRFTWDDVPGAVAWRLLRGSLETLRRDRGYDHVADESLGAGACRVPGRREHADPDDVADGADWYYLASAVNGCGGEGGVGHAWDGRTRIARPGRLPAPACP